MENDLNAEQRYWKKHEAVLFRFFFIYFILQALPLDWKFYRRLFQLNWLDIGVADIFNISRYTPQLTNTYTTADFWGIHTFTDWGIIALIALVGTAIWSLLSKKQEYASLYYWLRVILRYRLAAGIIAYGFIKLFPMQSPYPSLSELNTNYGDFSAWKLFSLTLGIAPSFQSFLGLVEVLAGLLLIYRKTVFVGSFVILCFTGNVFLSNLAYEGGEAVYSLYLVQFALFLLWYDASRLFRLLSLEKPTLPNTFKLTFSSRWQPRLRLVLKGAFLLFFVFFYGVKTHELYQQEGYQFPRGEGALPEGFYQVTDFSLNGRPLLYSATDSLRWQNVVIEKWPTISVKRTAPIAPLFRNVEIIHQDEDERDYEYSGTGGRQYYRYVFDQAHDHLLLKPLNGDTTASIQLVLNQPKKGTLWLSGVDAKGDSLQLVLQKTDKKYLLEEATKVGRRGRLVL